MNTVLDEPITATAFGDLVGVTQQAISQRVKDGLLVPGQPLREWIRGYCTKLREEAAGRSGDDQQSLTRARTREAEASAELKQIQIAEKAGTLVPLAAVEPGLIAMITAARQELLALPDRLATELRALYGVEIDPSLITERIHESLQHLASGLSADSVSDVDQGAVGVGTTADNDNHGVV